VTKTADHQAAAERHEAAAQSHERASRFWHEHGDLDRAGLQHEMAEYERVAAGLERRWAELTDADVSTPAVHAAASKVTATAKPAQPDSPAYRRYERRTTQLAAILSRTADALERSAELAEEHAHRRMSAGFREAAGVEFQAAARSRQAADRARLQAAEWLTDT
jgi:hypothetical protein